MEPGGPLTTGSQKSQTRLSNSSERSVGKPMRTARSPSSCNRLSVSHPSSRIRRAQALSPVRLCDPADCGLPGFLEWLPFPLPGPLPDPGIKPVSPASQTDSLPLSHRKSGHNLQKGLVTFFFRQNHHAFTVMNWTVSHRSALLKARGTVLGEGALRV